MTERQKMIFTTVVAITAACGLVALLLAILPIAIPAAANAPLIAPLFNTSLFLFSTGVATIFGLILSFK